MGDCLVLLPTEQRVPKSIIHFVGGFLAGTSAVTVAYSGILTSLADSGHLIVATPIPPFSVNHGEVAKQVTYQFASCFNNDIRKLIGNSVDDVPVIGLSHSLGGKLTALVNSRKEDRKSQPSRAGNVFMSFNNYGVKDTSELAARQARRVSPQVDTIIDAASQPEVKRLVNVFNTAKDDRFFGDVFQRATSALGDQLGVDIAKRVDDFSRDLKEQIGAQMDSMGGMGGMGGGIPTDIEFDPSPEETWALLMKGYNVQRNVVIQFKNDDIDQSNELAVSLRKRGCDVVMKTLAGNHLTPLTPNTLKRTIKDAARGVEDDELMGGVDGADAAVFLRDLVGTVNAIADEGWEEKDRRRRERLVLPSSTR